MPDENSTPARATGTRHRDDALQLGPRKKARVSSVLLDSPFALQKFLASCISDPLIGHGRHFGRTVHALCNVGSLLTNGILRLGEQADEPEESFTAEYVQHTQSIDFPPLTLFETPRQRREHRVFAMLLQMVPNLEVRLMEGGDEDVVSIAETVCRARSF